MGHITVASDRGQSSVIGVVLLLAITFIGIMAVMVMGTGVLADARLNAQIEQAESAMSQFDSQAALVALGSTETRQITFGQSNEDPLAINESAGRIRILVVNDTGPTTIVESDLGAITYEFERTTLAYQAGGVWRYQSGNSTMVSPPEYHYRDQTLTFPIIRVVGDSRSIGSDERVLITENGSEQHYPTATRTNPLDSGHINIKITSKYHQGWKSYFESRTEGAVHHDPGNQTVTVNLTIPITESFDNAVAATSDDGDAIDESSTSPHGGFDSPQETGADRPSASPRVDEKITDCESGGCDGLSSELGDGKLENGTYYENGDIVIDETTYDTTSGSINIVVNGDLEFAGSGGPPGTSHHTISGDGSVTFYVKGDVTISGNTGVNTDGESNDLLVLVHSDGGDVTTASGTPQFKGLIYAPNASLVINGGGSVDNIIGAVVVRDATAHGNGNVEFEHPINFEMEFETMTDITFLHVTENRIEITDV